MFKHKGKTRLFFVAGLVNVVSFVCAEACEKCAVICEEHVVVKS